MRAILLIVITLCSFSVQAEAIDPGGIYLNSYSGQFSGTEWFQVVPTADGKQFLLTDIRGGGFTAGINDQGTITFDNGMGSFSGDDTFTLSFPLDGAFTFNGTRAQFTDQHFPLVLEVSPQAGDSQYGGTFRSQTQIINPVTGSVIGEENEQLAISVDGTTLRITDPQGFFFQGIFIDKDRVAFRSINSPRSSGFASFAGSTQNLNQDMLGELVFSDPSHFTATILLQSLAPLGAETQTLVRLSAERIDIGE